MEEMVRYTTGFMGVVSTAIVFVLSFAGVFLGWLILRNHLKEK
jgi:energy-coupling factor transport system substrate-specific component